MSLTGRILITSLISVALLVIVAASASAMEGPDVVELDVLSNIYTAVTFDHAMHADMATCASCHHHTTGTATEDTKCMPCHAASDAARARALSCRRP